MGVGLGTAMWSGVSGLQANSTRMTTIGNNLSNTNTVGFKGARADFVDLMSATIGTASGVDQVGRGVRVGSVVNDFSQGGLETTSENLDMAISGNGFFMVKQKSQVGSNGKMLNTGNTTTYYTRAGDFSFDKDGYLTSTTGLAVQGWKVDQNKIDSANAAGTTLSQTPVTGEIQDIVLDSYSSPAKATTNVTVITNLDSDSTGAATRTSSNYFYAMSESWDGTASPAMSSDNYTYQTTLKVYDANGSPHTLTVYYDKVASENGSEYWEYAVTCDPTEDGRVDANGNPLYPNSKEAGLLSIGTMTFDSSGSMTNMSAYNLTSAYTNSTTFNPADWSVASTSNGYPTFTANFKGVSNASFTDQSNATLVTLNLGMRNTTGFTDPTGTGNLSGVTNDPTTLAYFNPATLKINSNVTTNYATSSSTVFSSQNGYTAGLLTSVSVDTNGVLTGTFSNGQTLQMWVLALANFTNLQGLSREGNNLYKATLDSGQGTTNRANTGSVGSVSGNTLESSNVDMATEMVNMIVTQRGFEANSKTITTVDSMLSEVIQLKR